MRNRRAERRLGLRPPGVDMDPLMVARRIRKGVDAVLRDREPVAGRDLLSDQPGEVRQIDDGHAASP